jgi:hypothetical protein
VRESPLRKKFLLTEEACVSLALPDARLSTPQWVSEMIDYSKHCAHNISLDEFCESCFGCCKIDIDHIRELRNVAQKSIELILNELSWQTGCKLRVDVVDAISLAKCRYVCDITLEI